MSDVLLYTTQGCHLCEQAEQVLEPVLAYLNTHRSAGMVTPLQLRTVEIADAAELVERYGLRIPVIRLPDDDADLGWPFDEEMACVFLEQQLSGRMS